MKISETSATAPSSIKPVQPVEPAHNDRQPFQGEQFQTPEWSVMNSVAHTQAATVEVLTGIHTDRISVQRMCNLAVQLSIIASQKEQETAQASQEASPKDAQNPQ